jgi:hypothetical protein
MVCCDLRWPELTEKRFITHVAAEPAPDEIPLKGRKTMPKFLMALSLLFLTATSATVAAQGQPDTDQEQKACARDVQKFCRTLMDQGESVIFGCLKGNRRKLSQDCNKMLIRLGQ